MNDINLKNKKVTVIGLGLHGGAVGVIKWLIKKGAKVLVTDLKDKEELKPSLKKLKNLPVKYVLGRHRFRDFKGVDLIIQNPAVPFSSPYLKFARRHKIPIESDISLFFRLCPAPIIGISGTKGKSTITTLVGECFKKINSQTVIAGNIRKTPLLFLDKITKDTPVILELSSWQLESIKKLKKSPHLALLSNIYPDHLNRYPSFESYIKAKRIIFDFQTSQDAVVLNYDNKITRFLGKEVPSRRFWFSKKFFSEENGVFKKGNFIYFRYQGKIKKTLSLKELNYQNEGDLENRLGALTLLLIAKIPLKIIKKIFKQFSNLPGRLELIGEIKKIKFYNDTCATTPEASCNALESLAKKFHFSKPKIILIAGGADKNLDYKKWAKIASSKTKKILLLEGSATYKMIKYLPQNKIKGIYQSLYLALKDAFKEALPKDIILLSPAAASFGMFKHEFDRGEKFKKAYLRLKNKKYV